MQAQMITGFFKYEPCELNVADGVLNVRLMRSGDELNIISAREASFLRMSDGSGRLSLLSEGRQYEFVMPKDEAREAARDIIYDLTRESMRIELRAIDV